jgi:hypothetical protein
MNALQIPLFVRDDKVGERDDKGEENEMTRGRSGLTNVGRVLIAES